MLLLLTRPRDEVGDVRQSRDPIEYVKKLLVDFGFATPEELKAIEKSIRTSVEESLNKAKKGSFPAPAALIDDIYATPDGKSAPLSYVRLPDIAKSYVRA